MGLLDKITDVIRDRWSGKRTDAHEEVSPDTNRGTLRRVGIQGRRGMIAFKDGRASGQPRGRFLGPGKMPAILISNKPKLRLISRKTTRERRTDQRMRAKGELA